MREAATAPSLSAADGESGETENNNKTKLLPTAEKITLSLLFFFPFRKKINKREEPKWDLSLFKRTNDLMLAVGIKHLSGGYVIITDAVCKRFLLALFWLILFV